MSIAEIRDPEPIASWVVDEPLYEIVDGEIVEMPPMGFMETRIAFKIGSKIEQFAEPRRLGQAITEGLFRIQHQPNRQRRPDAAFVSAERWPVDRPIPSGNALDVVPDLAVEVVSPTNSAEEIQVKVGEYLAAGVRRVWVIYVNVSIVHEHDSESLGTIRVLRLGDSLEGGSVLEGFRLELADLFGKRVEAPRTPVSDQ